MRVVCQRVSHAKVIVNQKTVGEIKKGFLLYVGIHVDDEIENVIKMAEKIMNLRIFEDSEEKMNLNIQKVNGSILAISQFTLYGDTKKGNRPSFINAARPDKANHLYEQFIFELEKLVHVEKGIFGEKMEVISSNDGPVTIIIEN
jgi:D-tyrosyl-tRNA(Tyr) deacylase